MEARLNVVLIQVLPLLRLTRIVPGQARAPPLEPALVPLQTWHGEPVPLRHRLGRGVTPCWPIALRAA